MRMHDLFALQTLKLKQSMSGAVTGPLAEQIIDQAPGLHNVCCKVSTPLFNRLDSVCQTLDLSKRQFIEAALIEACDIAEAHLETLED